MKPDHTLSVGPSVGTAETGAIKDLEQRFLILNNQTAVPYPRNATISSRFAEQVAARPEAIALVDGEQAITYRELAARAAVIAQRLTGLVCTPGAAVAVALPKGIDLVAALLGVLGAGGAYLPVDPQLPVERQSFLLSDGDAVAVITDPATGALLPRHSLPTVLPTWDGSAPQFPPLGAVAPQATDPAYILYTSGSTGTPKGVIVPHRAVIRLTVGNHTACAGPERTHAFFAPVAFDASALELWAALLNGGRLVLPGEAAGDLIAMADLILRHGVDTLALSTGIFQQLAESRPEVFTNMVQVIVGGDVLSPGTCRGVLTRFPRLRLLNGYGPTENGTTSTAQVVTLADCAGPIPIGRPTPNTTVYILDRNLAPTPVGKIGEIVAGGEGVALGYHKRPELTAECFLPDPFIPGGRMYRTGDLGLWRADGVIEFAGRIDDQVKIRGYRIELGEIEAALTLHPAVAEAAVIVREDVAGSKQLAAYISPRVVGVMPDLREHLRTVLPTYMLPSACMWLERMPLTANGKIDRKGLLALGKISGLHIEPWTATQIHLLTICRDLFQRQDIGLRDEFFAIGGTSLLAARLIERIEREMAVQLAPSVLIEATTVERLADAITRVGMPTGPDADPVVLNPDASGLPVVVLHGDLLGGGVYCRRLSTLLPNHQLLIFSPPLGHGTPDSSSIAAIAQRIRTQLLAVRPVGPFVLVGFCIYGLVAWEVARQLQHSGHAVAEVVLLDAEALPGFYQNIHGLCAGFDRNPTQAQNRLLRWHHTILRLKDINRLTWLEKIHYVQRKCLGKMTARAPVDAEVYQASGVDIGTLANHLWIWAGYRPLPMEVRVCLITSDEGASPGSHLATYWQKRATQTTCHHLGGRHLDLITGKLPEVSGLIARPS